MHDICTRDLQLTKFIAHRPGLIIIKMNVSLPVCPWEISMSQDPTRAIEGQIITMPVANMGNTDIYTVRVLSGIFELQ